MEVFLEDQDLEETMPRYGQKLLNLPLISPPCHSSPQSVENPVNPRVFSPLFELEKRRRLFTNKEAKDAHGFCVKTTDCGKDMLNQDGEDVNSEHGSWV